MLALKMKAKESIQAKRAQSVTSGLRDGRMFSRELSEATQTHANLIDFAEQAHSPQAQTAQTNALAEESSSRSVEAQRNEPTVLHTTITNGVDDLLAESRNAAPSAHHDRRPSLPPTTFGHEKTHNVGTSRDWQQPEGRRTEAKNELQVAAEPGSNVRSDNDDVEMWLAITGYHDQPYREKLLSRRRRLKEIEEERLRLLEEEQADQSIRGPVYPSTDPAPLQRTIKGSYTAQTGISANTDNTRSDAVASAANPLAALPEAENRAAARARKRGSVEDEMTHNKGYPTRKLARTQPYRQTSPGARYKSNGVYRQSSFSDKDTGNPFAAIAIPQSYENRDILDSDVEGREIRHVAQGRRPQSALSQNRPGRLQTSRSGLALPDKADGRGGRVRFFLLKSWNQENITAAQREGTWATQTKNEEIFVDAFRSCHHVIFVFSANHSKAFQGYARMQGVPGERGVESPSWRENLHWPTTEPFRIKWITKGETPYWKVGNLKNPLNEHNPVFVGRDGQEIPEEVGDELCDVIDENAAPRNYERR